MDQFEYVMVLVSIIVGIGVAHILLGVGGIIDRVSRKDDRLELSLAQERLAYGDAPTACCRLGRVCRTYRLEVNVRRLGFFEGPLERIGDDEPERRRQSEQRCSRRDVLEAYCHAFVANLVSAAVRLIPLGQTDGQAVTAAMQGDVSTAVSRALAAALDDVASSCPVADIMSMQHEVQYTRLFRS